ncbi:LuxR C-terminal-related transcriptional regulator [Actinoplanes sp. N902-109]|uniref:LuxR C-terminal-related transcriptional regulator n=1 Tax=Actinoplanes sp. (strain N902-109) TaxID=649831 RepID=UPI00059F07A5|nr:LuxR C-terminal-related transcriptional regulator [Actinoplanes sp. N902-109]
MTDRPAPEPPLFGRDAEISALRSFLSDPSSHRNVLIITSEPGMGGTALLAAATAEAHATGVHVVPVAGARSDHDDPFAGLRQIVGQLAGTPVLAPDRWAGLATVLADHTTALSRLGVFTALLTALRQEDGDTPLLIAVDDAHALDDASAEALAFVARRLPGSRTGMLVVSQSCDGPLSPRAKLPAMALGPLPDEAAADLLASRFPELSAEVRDLLVDTAEGMPLALVGCAGVLVGEQRVAAEAVPAALPVSGRLRAVLTAPLARLADTTLMLLLLLALDSSVTQELLAQMTGLDVRERLGPVLSMGLITMTRSGAIMFPRPLTRTAVVAAATPAQRRQAHAVLARGFADQVERRAHHLALSLQGPDPRAAAALQDAAVHALLRNDTRAAEQASSRAAVLRGDAGPPAADRLSARLLEASVAFDQGRPAAALHLLTRALEQRQPDAADETVNYAVDLLLAVCYLLGTAAAWSEFRRTIRRPGLRGNAPLRLVEQLAGPQANPAPGQLAELDAALDRLAAESDLRVVLHLAVAAAAVGRAADCQTLLWRVLRDDTVRPRRLLAAVLLAVVAFSTGDSAAAAKAVDYGLELCRAADHLPYAMLLRSMLLLSKANVGDPTLAELADEVLVWAKPVQAATLIENVHWALARDALGRSDHAAAHDEFARLTRDGNVAVLPVRRPEMVFDVVEAAAGSGRGALAWAIARRARFGLSSRLDLLAFGALAVAGRRDPTGWYETAMSVRGAGRWPFDVARIRLVHGEHLERAGARDLAREHLNWVLETFRALGAATWAGRAATRLRPAGEAVVGISHELPLTRQETTVAELAVSGLTNQEIAERLHISTRTVASHLYRIFNKIGVTSRAQLPDALTSW